MQTRLALVALAALLAASSALGGDETWTVLDAPSKFNGRVIITEQGNERTLLFRRGGARQTVVRIGEPNVLSLPYTRTAMVSLALVPEPKRSLIIGLGGGAMAMFLRGLYPKLDIDGVDIDPVVVAAAETHLGLKLDPKLRAIVADGRKFTEGAPPGYDLVFLDAYADEDPPSHLMTVEYLRTVRAKLTPAGLAVGNVWGPGDNKKFLDVVRTWELAFGGYCVLQVPDAGNTIFLARGDGQPPAASKDALSKAAAAFSKKHGLKFDLEDEVDEGCKPQGPGGKVLRDPEKK